MAIVSIKRLKTKWFGQKDKTTVQPAQPTSATVPPSALTIDVIKQLLQADPIENTTYLYGDSIHHVTASSIHAHELIIHMAQPPAYSGNPEALHEHLLYRLAPFGIKSVELHLEKAPTAMSPSSSTTNIPAMHTPENATTKQPSTQQSLTAHPRIKHIIVVSSGKGGVGKSTTTVNLARALKALHLRVGILDADIYGPSIPTMLGLEGKTPLIENDLFVPLDAEGIPTLSIGNLTGDSATPIVWRGPKATGALLQLYEQTLWPELDILLIDMPPGTGDIQLTLSQRIPVTGAVIVTTPQHIALMDAQKGIEMFRKVDIPILGLVENMAIHVCSQCGHHDAIFGSGGGLALSELYGVPLLGQLPLDSHIRDMLDQGKTVQKEEIHQQYNAIAQALLEKLHLFTDRHTPSNRFF